MVEGEPGLNPPYLEDLGITFLFVGLCTNLFMLW